MKLYKHITGIVMCCSGLGAGAQDCGADVLKDCIGHLSIAVGLGLTETELSTALIEVEVVGTNWQLFGSAHTDVEQRVSDMHDLAEDPAVAISVLQSASDQVESARATARSARSTALQSVLELAGANPVDKIDQLAIRLKPHIAPHLCFAAVSDSEYAEIDRACLIRQAYEAKSMVVPANVQAVIDNAELRPEVIAAKQRIAAELPGIEAALIAARVACDDE